LRIGVKQKKKETMRGGVGKYPTSEMLDWINQRGESIKIVERSNPRKHCGRNPRNGDLILEVDKRRGV
jgi:hypothetical protein